MAVKIGFATEGKQISGRLAKSKMGSFTMWMISMGFWVLKNIDFSLCFSSVFYSLCSHIFCK